MVLIGHSMGGVLARLLVSNSGDQLWESVLERYNISQQREKSYAKRLSPT